VHVAVTGSIATDHLMTFPGRFADSLVVEQLDKVSLSFLVDDLQIRRGGIAANIAFGLGNLGVRAVLVGAVGQDWLEYESWLERHGVDTSHVLVSDIAHTARFVCTTDADHAQMASFYAGAMAEARNIELRPIADVLGGLDLVVISPNDPVAMLRHTDECRERGYPFVSDPSHQLAWLDGEQIRQLIDGAAYLFTNAYESSMVEHKTGWSQQEITSRVGVRVVTHGRDGARVESPEGCIDVPVAPEKSRADPTGVGDAFRAGFIAGLAWQLGHERCAQLGSLLAAHVIETVGTQEYKLKRREFLDRFTRAYGAAAADEVAARLRSKH
jgi:adenosine kinase